VSGLVAEGFASALQVSNGRGVQSTNRCLAAVVGGRARLQSRQQRSLTKYFPEIVAALGDHFDDVVLDGELVVAAGRAASSTSWR
jgi:hypothetical protein